MLTIKFFLIGVILLLVVIGDMRNYKVKNSLILIGVILSFICSVLEGGINSLNYWFFGISGPIIILFLLFVFKVLGAGDIKLFSVIGGFFGIHFVLKVIVAAFVIGAILAIFHFIRHKDLMSRLQYLAKYFSKLLKEKQIKSYYSAEKDGRNCVIHFTPAIAFSTFLIHFCEKNPEFIQNGLKFIC